MLDNTKRYPSQTYHHNDSEVWGTSCGYGQVECVGCLTECVTARVKPLTLSDNYFRSFNLCFKPLKRLTIGTPLQPVHGGLLLLPATTVLLPQPGLDAISQINGPNIYAIYLTKNKSIVGKMPMFEQKNAPPSGKQKLRYNSPPIRGTCCCLYQCLFLTDKNFHVERKRRLFRALNLYIKRNAMVRHDFRAKVIRCHILIPNGDRRPTQHSLDKYKSTLSFYSTKSGQSNCKKSTHHSDPCADGMKPWVAQIGGGPKPIRARGAFTCVETNRWKYDPSVDMISETVNGSFKYEEHISEASFRSKYANKSDYVACRIPLMILSQRLPMKSLKIVAGLHKIPVTKRMKSSDIRCLFESHASNCKSCDTMVTVLKGEHHDKVAVRVKKHRDKIVLTDKGQDQNGSPNDEDECQHDFPNDTSVIFPPRPSSKNLIERIIKAYCDDISPEKISEVGCAVCGRLTLSSELQLLQDINVNLELLDPQHHGLVGVTCKERRSEHEPLTELIGKVLAPGCNSICKACFKSLSKGHLPTFSLTNGNWLGDIPTELKNLSYAEKLLISKVRHNRCIIRVSSGMHKMRANAVLFSNPMPKIYNILPPSKDELDEVLAFIYTGPCKPTTEDLKRTPMLVRRNKVAKALEWLKLNHIDYHDLTILYDNLASYSEDMPPVVVDYQKAEYPGNKNPESTSIDDCEIDDGTVEGDCPFTVHGLSGEQLSGMNAKALTAIALEHLIKGGKVLAIGHAENPESIYGNPQLYPQIFPWLFPYGLGGIGNKRGKVKISDILKKEHLLMYYDKRFQKEPHFPLIALNHEQIKSSTTGGFLLAEKSLFNQIADRLMRVDQDVLKDLAQRLASGERVRADSEAEKDCFELMRDLDHIGQHVQGSITNKKYMRNEIWSLIAYQGAPSWFITFSPADIKHPICLYFADSKQPFEPELPRTADERYRLIANNPVAGARFFNFMVQLFLTHVLGINTDHPGLYGETSAYYGTVEQQGRLTLHLHLLLWIKNSLTPQEIRNKIMDPKSEFVTKLVDYLEGAQVGEFLNGSMDEIKCRVGENSKLDSYRDPTETLPVPPPPRCENDCMNCDLCKRCEHWWEEYTNTVDDLLLKSNVHKCGLKCMANKERVCKARFPREIFTETMIDKDSGALHLKKKEPQVNTVTPSLTYLQRCNSDVTSLLSGTAIKAIVAYVTDYVTKPSLKLYSMFDTIRGMINKNSDILSSTIEKKEKARKMLTKMVNSLTANMEMGGPMAALYLLKFPDHYTNYKFKAIYWRPFVSEAMNAWVSKNDEVNDDTEKEKVVINKNNNRYVWLSPVLDYTYRPIEYQDVNLYDWIRCHKKRKVPSKPKKTRLDTRHTNEEGEYNTEQYIGAENEEEYNEVLNRTESEEAGAKRTKYLQFMTQHPQHESHEVTMVADKNGAVPNFIGGTLPRSDKGDREYYCCTMLTLFKPWRDGMDLKSGGTSWDETFSRHVFSPRQQEIMNYFNVRYECNDARDDFYKQRMKAKNGKSTLEWLNNDMVNGLDDICDDIEYDPHVDELQDEMALQCRNIGKGTARKLQQMQDIEKALKMAGWVDGLLESDTPSEKFMRLEPELKTRAKWMDILLKAKQNVLLDREKNMTRLTVANDDTPRKTDTRISKFDQVKVVDQNYLSFDFKAPQLDDRLLIDQIIADYTLNTEQERAFRIVANHASYQNGDQLKMYLGGMGGTGKSQVIQALMFYFKKRNESHRFVVMAPTGSAAALVNGSTYHSLLGIMDKSVSSFNNGTALNQVKARLEGVQYIFLDEVSMISCQDLYSISAQLALASNMASEPFGGMNMIFAGDFAQLPPAMSSAPLYLHSVGTQLSSGMTQAGQKATIGKALWHQVTTAVILRQNMRQRSQTDEDKKLRTALENMRYKSCTDDDIKFLRTLIAGRQNNQPKLAQTRFRNVSVITGLNVHRDKINELGTHRFATENEQPLHTFYSYDQWARNEDPSTGKKMRKKRNKLNPIRNSNSIGPNMQEILWNLPPAATSHNPGKLDLCVGMPVLIKRNEATECCVTNGAEAIVMGWQSYLLQDGKEGLDVVFVKLKNPSKHVTIDGLPENVVPIARRPVTVKCTLPDDSVVEIVREQPAIIPNFAMTDYASQGRTRPNNVVDLQNCRTHQSYYTCLSRSSTASGTVILQGFDAKKITGGLPGYMRQEFRELEILNEISRLKYLKLLPNNVQGHRRNDLIQSFQQWKGTTYMPEHVHNAIQWSSQYPMQSTTIKNDSEWQIIGQIKTKREIYPIAKLNVKEENDKGASTKIDVAALSLKRKRDVTRDDILPPLKKVKSDTYMNYLDDEIYVRGLIWDNINYSCAYDSVFTILYCLWGGNIKRWGTWMSTRNTYLKRLAEGFDGAKSGANSLEYARDKVRLMLHNKNPTRFPMKHEGTSLVDMCEELFTSERPYGDIFVSCSNCKASRKVNENKMLLYHFHYDCHSSQTIQTIPQTTADWFKSIITRNNRHDCDNCLHSQQTITKFNEVPYFIAINLNLCKVTISDKLYLRDKHDRKRCLLLRGIIYYGSFHFTARLIMPNGDIWYHDGMTTGSICRKEGNIHDLDASNPNGLFKDNNNRQASIALYARRLSE